MLGIIVQLLISWLIIWLFEKGNLSIFGFYPTTKRLIGFFVFFIVTALCSSSDYFMRMLFAKQQWELNPQLNAKLILTGIWWNVKSVLFEELIFRGVLLYMLIKKLGPVTGIIISSIAFGIYHWYSHEVIGNIQQMAITFVTTGLMGSIYAYAYAKTFSLYIPISIHLGWNLVRSVVFSETVIGGQLFVQVQPVPEVTVSYFIYFCILLIPMLSALLINYFMLRRKQQVVL
ncbi:MAG: CPBP family intramembrane glutamic endopeptidase [Ferruginibacter sp.]